MTQKDDDLRKIEELIKIMKENDLVEVEIKHDEDKIFLKRAQSQLHQTPITGIPIIAPMVQPNNTSGPAELVQTQKQAQQTDIELVEITSPIVGTFYAKPSPDAESYVEIGSAVEPQTVVCIIEAMKVMNEIKAETTGTIAEILVTNGQAVEYGQVLFKVRAD
jgi:acetyl-CoA carboxylase biotin carboxyl carrier protein